jgi:carbamate kinase
VVKEEEGYRRIVAAPQPIDIVEIEAIKTLADADQVVIACGGGGIPVIEQQHILKGASAVIEKDSIAGKLASDLKADELLILTNVDYVCLNYGKENEQQIKSMTVGEAKKYIDDGQFGETDMLPKINAAITYLEAVPNGKAVITSLKKTADVISEKVGTIITK